MLQKGIYDESTFNVYINQQRTFPLLHSLLILYNCESYRGYCFQSQHPYIYSNSTIAQYLGIFNKANKDYIAELERFGRTDTAIWVNKLK